MLLLIEGNDRVVAAILALLAAAICLHSGVWGLRGHDVWLPPGGDSPHDTAMPDPGTTVRGRAARWVGLALVAAAIALLALAARLLWR